MISSRLQYVRSGPSANSSLMGGTSPQENFFPQTLVVACTGFPSLKELPHLLEFPATMLLRTPGPQVRDDTPGSPWPDICHAIEILEVHRLVMVSHPFAAWEPAARNSTSQPVPHGQKVSNLLIRIAEAQFELEVCKRRFAEEVNWVSRQFIVEQRLKTSRLEFLARFYLPEQGRFLNCDPSTGTYRSGL